MDVYKEVKNLTDPLVKAHSEVCAELARVKDEIEGLKRELALIDEALARRPALSDLPNRYSKICRACNVASRAESAEAALAKILGPK